MKVFSYSPNKNLNCLAVDMGDIVIYQSYESVCAIRCGTLICVLGRGYRSVTMAKHIGYVLRFGGVEVREVTPEVMKDIIKFYEKQCRSVMCRDRCDEMRAFMGCDMTAKNI